MNTINFTFTTIKDFILKTVIYILCILLPLASYSQDYDIDFYCLGYMSDYMGRRIEKGDQANENSLDDFFHQSRMHELYRLDTLIKINNLHNKKIKYEIVKKKKIVGHSNHHEFYHFNSKVLCKKINKFYKFKMDEGYTVFSKTKSYTGKLEVAEVLAANRKQKLSFIAGTFYRYGDIDTTGYYFKFGNSIEKLNLIRILLREYNCKITKDFNNQVDGLHIAPFIVNVYFTPSIEIKKILDYEFDMKIQLKNTHAGAFL